MKAAIVSVEEGSRGDAFRAFARWLAERGVVAFATSGTGAALKQMGVQVQDPGKLLADFMSLGFEPERETMALLLGAMLASGRLKEVGLVCVIPKPEGVDLGGCAMLEGAAHSPLKLDILCKPEHLTDVLEWHRQNRPRRKLARQTMKAAALCTAHGKRGQASFQFAQERLAIERSAATRGLLRPTLITR